ncbi:putative coat protein [Pythium polare RNA virus 1]|uniref:Putative coat protein n=1 Tax=Pythium polare RNA virus 1 TaxID=2137353 RepID=A0A2Z6C486_9VIRU|nr:putative coat protein [Pythium polare RNA virus 1]BBD50442.1 putative coat protein [Pythium polare RNA virus 1]
MDSQSSTNSPAEDLKISKSEGVGSVRVDGVFDFFVEAMPEIALSVADLQGSAMISHLVSDQRMAAIAAADQVFLSAGSGAISPFVRSARTITQSGSIAVLPVATPTLVGGARAAPWNWPFRRVPSTNVQSTAFLTKVDVARAAEKSGFDAGYQKFRRYDNDGLLGLIPSILLEQPHLWLSWIRELSCRLAFEERDAQESAALSTMTLPSADGVHPVNGAVAGLLGDANPAFFGRSVGRMSEASSLNWEEGLAVHLQQPAGAAAVVCPEVTESWCSVVTRGRIPAWIEQAQAGNLSAEVFVSRARSPRQLLGDMAAAWAERSRSGSFFDQRGRMWVLAPHVDLEEKRKFLDFGGVHIHPTRHYSWSVISQAVASGGPQFPALPGTSRDVLAIVRHLACERVTGTLPGAGDQGGHNPWDTALGSSPWQVRLAAALGFVEEMNAAKGSYLPSGGPLTNILAFEGVRLGRGFDRVWQSVCGCPASLAGWRGRGDALWAAGLASVNCLYGSSGAGKPLGVFFTSDAPDGIASAPDIGPVTVYARQRWGSYGWSANVPSEWGSLDAQGSKTFTLDHGNFWEGGSLDSRSLSWAMLLTHDERGTVRMDARMVGVQMTRVDLRLRGPQAHRRGAHDSFEVPVFWVKNSFRCWASTAWLNVADGIRSFAGVYTTEGLGAVRGPGASCVSGGLAF